MVRKILSFIIIGVISIILVAQVEILFSGHSTFTRHIIAPRANTDCVIVNLDRKKYAHILDHAWDASLGSGKEPAILHIDREDAAKHRKESLRGIPTKPGFDRDEYPPAATREGGTGASVRYVRSAENRGAGEIQGRTLAKYPDGQCWSYEPRQIK